MKLAVLLLSVLLPVCVCAQCLTRLDAYDPPLRWTPAHTLTDTVSSVGWESQLRFEVPVGKNVEVRALIDSVYGIELRSDTRNADDLMPAPLYLRITRADSVVADREIGSGLDTRSRIFTLRLTAQAERLAVNVARGKEQPSGCFEFTLPDGAQPRVISYSTAGDCLLRMHSFASDRTLWPQYSRFGSEAELHAYLSASTNPREGCWAYFDRSTNPQFFTPGGEYKIATVADGHDGYEIVYLSGARMHGDSWVPLRLKGRLHHAGFISQYNLEWFQPDGLLLNGECSAELTAEGLLTLRFPAAQATVRFRRL